MPSVIEYTPSDELPKLGWLAEYDTSADRLSVIHGKAVECREDWLVEGVWDGEFPDGGFHRSRHLFGSGIRLDDGAVRFVPSCALVDRLFYCRDGGALLVSNSLIILLAATGARLARAHDYRIEGKAILAGIDDYADEFHVEHPRIPRFHQVFHKTIAVRNGALTLERSIGLRAFETFADYRESLRRSLEAIVANAAHPTRRTRLTPFGTLSSGYDSTAVTALVRDLGVERFFTYAGSWRKKTEGRAEYETSAIADALDIRTLELSTAADAAPEAAEDELLLRASSPLGQQFPLLTMASYIERRCEGALVFTGFHGDIVWDVNVPDEYVTDQIRRHDVSGLDLSELRLKCGFFNVAVPFLFAASIASIAEVSRLPEMAPWRLGNRYDRPISRRIVEEAGVARGLFGIKKAGIFGGGARPVHAELRSAYFAHLRRNEGMSLPLAYLRLAADRAVVHVLGRAAGLVKGRPFIGKLQRRIAAMLSRLNEGESWFGKANSRVLLYRWAVMELGRRLEAASVAARRVPAEASPRSDHERADGLAGRSSNSDEPLRPASRPASLRSRADSELRDPM